MFIGEWLIYAMMSLSSWGTANVIDTFFVEEEIYKNANEGMIVSSIFKVVGFLIIGIIFFDEALNIAPSSALLLILAGVLLSVSFWFYFRTTIMYNDLSLVQIFWNLSVPMVTFLGWWFLGERLNINSYYGIGIIIFGAACISLSRKSFNVDFKKFLSLNIPLVIFYSFSEVIVKYVEEVGGVDFWSGFPYLCLGQIIYGVVVLSYNLDAVNKSSLLERILKKKNYKLVIFSEIVELLGFFFMMLSISKAPNIAFYATTDAFMAPVIIVMTGIAGKIMKARGKSESLNNVYENNHKAGIWVKIFATIIMAVGIYFME